MKDENLKLMDLHVLCYTFARPQENLCLGHQKKLFHKVSVQPDKDYPIKVIPFTAIIESDNP